MFAVLLNVFAALSGYHDMALAALTAGYHDLTVIVNGYHDF